ncbi:MULTISPECIES: hypothetical protein [Nocardioides]|uniref:hypothetical protein n=1 Tax=Nocardioides TaxID=1839 RepID=UPI0004222CA0|nr:MULTISPECIES: hypothetical protein [Nocardioides]
MSDAPEQDTPEAGSPEPEWVRRKRLAAVFGDVLPEQTSDDRSPGSRGDGAGDGKGDDWYRDQVPPHHG